MKKAAVFGSARPVPGEPDYEAAFQIGKLLAQRNFGVVTGGYMGTMEAVSKGASVYGGEVVGVTCEEIEKWRPIEHNAYVQHVIHCITLDERIRRLINEADAGAIALPGGIGTLAEIAMFWNHVVIHPTDIRPLVFVGDGWLQTLNAFHQYQKDHLPEELPKNITFCTSVQETLECFIS
ncbi:MAG: LOG family protein [Anaerolineaceae bacterium]|nr:LOG family protein [Anaerolineaceae bacterium]